MPLVDGAERVVAGAHVRLPARRAVPGARRGSRPWRRSPRAATRSRPVAEDAAGNPSRASSARSIVDGTAAGARPRAGQRPDDHRGRSPTRCRASRAGRSRSATGAPRRSPSCRPRCATGGWWRRSRGRCRPHGVGIRGSAATDRAGNAVSGGGHLDEPVARASARAARKVRNARADRALRPRGHRLRAADHDRRRAARRPGGRRSTSQLRPTGATPVALTSVRTDAGGRFSLAVPAGPSRLLRVVLRRRRRRRRRGTRSVALRVAGERDDPRRPRACCAAPGRVRFSGRLRTARHQAPAGRQDRRPAGLPGRALVDRRHHPRDRSPRHAGSAVARFRGTPGRYPVRLRIRREAAVPLRARVLAVRGDPRALSELERSRRPGRPTIPGTCASWWTSAGRCRRPPSASRRSIPIRSATVAC